jgi:hypothetical protein
MDLDKIERQIVKALGDLHWPRSNSKVELTERVKKALSGIGNDLGLSVYGDAEWAESLYDQCWRKEDDDERIQEMPLAMECEWAQGYGALLGDFQKLVVSRANHRVFICSPGATEVWNRCVDYLTEQIQFYSGTEEDDRYLFGRWTSDGWEFRQYVHPTSAAPSKLVWLFQAIPERFDIRRELKRRKTDNWTVTTYRDYLRPGDIVLLWQAGSEAGVYGLAELTSKAWEEKKGDWLVAMRYTKLLDQPILKSRLCGPLQDLGVIAAPRGTNFLVRDDEWHALEKLLAR